MDFSRLEQHICDVIKEDQIKLGYRKETIRLYYPLASLNHFLNTDFDAFEMRRALDVFGGGTSKALGRIEISNVAERFCFCLLPEASEYVYTHTPQGGFLYDFIEAVSRHGTTAADVIEVFYRYSDRVHVEKAAHGEFDYLVYFEDGAPDTYRYCIKDEGCHVIYHRFTPEDYADLMF